MTASIKLNRKLSANQMGTFIWVSLRMLRMRCLPLFIFMFVNIIRDSIYSLQCSGQVCVNDRVFSWALVHARLQWFILLERRLPDSSFSYDLRPDLHSRSHDLHSSSAYSPWWLTATPTTLIIWHRLSFILFCTLF